MNLFSFLRRFNSPATVCGCALTGMLVCISPAIAQDISVAPTSPTVLTFAPDVFGGFASDHVLVKLKPGARFIADGEGRPSLTPTFNAAMRVFNVQAVRQASSHIAANREAATAIGLDRWYVLDLPAGSDSPMISAAFAQMTDVVEVAEFAGVGGTAGPQPDDPLFDLQYGLHNVGQVILGNPGVNDADTDMLESFSVFTGLPNVTLAVIDSGVDPHVDFAGRLLQGFNTVVDSTDTSDSCPHGTHVAGIAGATGDNGMGISGVHWQLNILPVRVLNGCSGTTTDCADGITWAVDNGADIGTMSLQYYSFSQYFEDAVTYATTNGVLLIAAAGNNFGGTVAWPAKFADVMGVSATDNDDELAWFSNWGNEVDVAAPGQDILSTWVGDAYTYSSGTSMATPYVSGLAALMLSYNPTLTPSQIRNALTSTADDLGTPGWDNRFGSGRINGDAAIQFIAPAPIDLTSTILVSGSPATATANGCTPGAEVIFVRSTKGPGTRFSPTLGVSFGLRKPVLLGSTIADGAGEASFTMTLTNGSIGRRVWLQALEVGNRSNTIVTVIQ